MEVCRGGGVTMIVEAECAVGCDEDDENIFYCDCPFFHCDDGERSCLLMKEPYDMAVMESKLEVKESCPLMNHEALVRLKE